MSAGVSEAPGAARPAGLGPEIAARSLGGGERLPEGRRSFAASSAGTARWGWGWAGQGKGAPRPPGQSAARVPSHVPVARRGGGVVATPEKELAAGGTSSRLGAGCRPGTCGASGRGRACHIEHGDGRLGPLRRRDGRCVQPCGEERAGSGVLFGGSGRGGGCARRNLWLSRCHCFIGRLGCSAFPARWSGREAPVVSPAFVLPPRRKRARRRASLLPSCLVGSSGKDGRPLEKPVQEPLVLAFLLRFIPTVIRLPPAQPGR